MRARRGLAAAVLAWMLVLGCRQGPSGPPGLAAPPDLEQLSAGIRQQYQELIRRFAEEQEGGEPSGLAEVWGDLGHWHTLYRYPDSARFCYRKARELAPADPRWSYFLARQAAGEGLLEEARAGFETVLELAPESLPARIRLAELEELEQPEAAAELYRQALEQDPESGRAHYGLGKLALEADDPEAAVYHLEAALALAPGDPGSHYLLGLAYVRQGEPGLAEHHLSQVPEDNRDWGKISMPDPWVRQLRRLNISTRHRVRQATRASERGETRRALRILGQATTTDPDNPSIRNRYAQALAEAGRIDSALEQYRETLRRSPGFPMAHFRLGRLLARQNDLDAAEDHLRAAVETDPELIGAQLTLARVLLARGEPEEALARYARLRERSAEAAFWHGVVLIWLGRYGEASSKIEEDRRHWPANQRLRRLLARVLAASPRAEVRDVDRALELARLEGASRLTLADASTLAMAQAEGGRFDRAVALQRAAVEAAESRGLRNTLHRARRRLALYERRRPCRNPWERNEQPGAVESISVPVPTR